MSLLAVTRESPHAFAVKTVDHAAMRNHASHIIEIYCRRARDFDAERSRTLVEKAWLDDFCAHLPAGGSILDIGCGMGEPIARYLTENGFAVTGVDSSPDMIALCRERFPRRDWPNCDWIVADMRTLSLGKRFDGLLAWDSFFHLTHDDQRLMFPVFTAHAAAGAALMFTSGPRNDEALGAWRGDTLYHASFAPHEYRGLLADAGFQDVAFWPEQAACGGRSIWLAQMRGKAT